MLSIEMLANYDDKTMAGGVGVFTWRLPAAFSIQPDQPLTLAYHLTVSHYVCFCELTDTGGEKDKQHFFRAATMNNN